MVRGGVGIIALVVLGVLNGIVEVSQLGVSLQALREPFLTLSILAAVYGLLAVLLDIRSAGEKRPAQASVGG